MLYDEHGRQVRVIRPDEYQVINEEPYQREPLDVDKEREFLREGRHTSGTVRSLVGYSRRLTRHSARRSRAWAGRLLRSVAARVRVGAAATAARCRATPRGLRCDGADRIDCQLAPGGDFNAARVVGPDHRSLVAALREGQEPVGGVQVRLRFHLRA